LIAGILPEHVANAATAKALYSAKQSPEDFVADWHFAVRDARRLVARALRASAFLREIRKALEENCGHSVVFRRLMAPPVSQDQFKLICPQWSKYAEDNCRPATLGSAEAAAKAIKARLDPGLVKWIISGKQPTRQELRTVLKVTAALVAQQTVATARRTRLAFEQEYAVIELLLKDGWTQLPRKLIDTRAAVPLKYFMHKTRFATKTRPQEVDIACGLKGTYVLAMECKVTNDETNSIKRVNDVLKKATAWHEHWGSFVHTVALLQGVVAPKDVQRLTDANVAVFWSHDLEAFRVWLAASLQ
jgi:hypothetical protein